MSAISTHLDAALKAAETKVTDSLAPITPDGMYTRENTADITASSTPVTTEVSETIGTVLTDDDSADDMDVMKNLIVAAQNPASTPVSQAEKTIQKSETFEDAKKDIYELIPDIANEDKQETAVALYNEIAEYRKNMIISYGLTPEEADKAASTRLMNRGKEINDNYKKAHPDAIIMVNKENAKSLEDLNFTEDEKTKLQNARAIRLVEVEDQDLHMIKSSKIPPHVDKVSFIRNLDAAISSYRVPLPVMGDYAQLTGAQTIQMATAFGSEDDSILDLTVKQAQLVYDRFFGSLTTKKYDDQNRTVMSYDEFINTMPYNDLDMLVYGVYVASTPEEQELKMKCGRCHKDFTWNINAKQLVDTTLMEEEIRNRMNDVLSHTQNPEYIAKLSKDWHTETRMKSPSTGNIYAFQQPTIAKALDVFQRVDMNDQMDAINAIFLIHLNTVFFKLATPDKEGNEYVELNYPDDVNAMLQLMKDIPESDLKLLSKYMRTMNYDLPLMIYPVCPHCDNHMSNKVSIEELVFQKAQNMSAEML